MSTNKITSIDFSKPVEDLNLPDDFSDLDEFLLPDDHFDHGEPELTCRVLLYVTILGQDYVLYKATRGKDYWYGTMPGDEYRRQQFKDVRRYNNCPDSRAGEAIRGRKLDALYIRYKETEENADAAFHRAFNEVYPCT